MSALDLDTLSAAFAEHTAGSKCFTRRMAIVLADMDGTTPRQVVLRCERLGLLKRGSWDWFVSNGGITAEQIREVRRSDLCASAQAHVERAIQPEEVTGE